MLFSGTVRDNLKFGNENADDETLWKALEVAQAKEIVEKKEGKLDFVIEQNGRNLSAVRSEAFDCENACEEPGDTDT